MTDEQRRLVTQLGEFTVCQVADALGSACAVETSLPPVDRNFRICGVACTVECAPGDNLTAHHALHLAYPGDVLIVASSPNCQGALWGELMSISAQKRSLAGAIINGPARDPLEIQALGYPVFCRRFDPRRVAKERFGHINVRCANSSSWRLHSRRRERHRQPPARPITRYHRARIGDRAKRHPNQGPTPRGVDLVRNTEPAAVHAAR